MKRSLAKVIGLFAPALAGAFVLGAAARPQLPGKEAPARNWNTAVVRTAGDTHVLGNPAAKVKLVEYVSYTCPHCAQFEEQADAQLRLGFVAGGKGSVEVRNFVRDPIDMTAALLAHCGPASKFFLNHAALMRSQSVWIGNLQNATPAQRERWSTGPFATRTRAIAGDFGFYRIMATRGYDRPALDRCLANETLGKRLAAATDVAVEKEGVSGTPSFMIDGVLLAGTHSWDALRPQIEARLR